MELALKGRIAFVTGASRGIGRAIALALAAHPRLESYDLSTLRYLMWCATPVTATVAEEVTRRTGVGWVTAWC